MKKMRNYFLIGLVCTAFTACLEKEESEFEKRQREEEQIITDYLDQNNIEATKGTYDLYYEVMDDSGSGDAPKENEIVSIFYKMTTLGGDSIDSAVESTDDPVRFLHGPRAQYNMIPKGIDLAVANMQKGDTYRFFIPSYFAYGSYSEPDVIDVREILKVEITLADIQTEADLLEIEREAIEEYLAAKEIEDYKEFSSGLYYKRTKEGSGNNPARGQTVKVHYVGTYLDGTEFDKSTDGDPLEVTNFGNGGLIEGFEDGLAEMKDGEEGILIIPSSLAYGGGIQVIPEQIREDYLTAVELRDIAPFKTLVFELEIVDIQ